MPSNKDMNADNEFHRIPFQCSNIHRSDEMSRLLLHNRYCVFSVGHFTQKTREEYGACVRVGHVQDHLVLLGLQLAHRIAFVKHRK